MDNKTFDLTKYGMIVCKNCNGIGYIEPKPYPDREACPRCGGFGLLEEVDEGPTNRKVDHNEYLNDNLWYIV